MDTGDTELNVVVHVKWTVLALLITVRKSLLL